MNNEVVGSMAEMISLMLNDFDKNDDESQVRLVLQVIPFFQEIFATISQNYKKNKQLHNASFTYLKSCSLCIKSVLNNENDSNTLATFINQFFLSCLAPECAEPITQLLISILTLDSAPNDNLSAFVTPLNSYFQSPDLRKEFIKENGFSLCWTTYITESENILIPLVFENLEKYHQFYLAFSFSSQIKKFFSLTSNGFSDLPSKKASFLMEFYEKIATANIKFFDSHFDSSFGFDTISNYILNHQDEDFYKYLESFMNMCQTDPNAKNKAVQAVVATICSGSCQDELRIRILNSLKDFINNSNISKPPFTHSAIDMMLSSIPQSDIESILALLSLCFILHIKTAFDISQTIISFLPFLHPEFLIKYDMTDLFALLILDPREVSKCINELYRITIESQTYETFSTLVNKYNNLFVLYVQHFIDDIEEEKKKTFLKYLILSFPYYTNKENARSCLYSIIVTKEGYKYTNTIFDYIEELAKTNSDISEFISFLPLAFPESKNFIQECANHKIQFRVISFYKKYGLSGQIILDFLSSMAQNRYDPVFDRQISEELKANDYFNMKPEELLVFALGLKQNQDPSKGSLCFPSLLGICSDYQFTDLCDLWICGQIGLSAWLKNTKKSICEFPSIIETASINMLIEDIESLIDYPSLFCQICEKIEHQPSLFLFKKQMNGSLSINIQHGFTKSITFWFQILEDDLTNSKLTTIFHIGITDVNVSNDQIKIDSNFVCKVTPRTWIFCLINFNNNDTLTITFNHSVSRTFKPSVTTYNSVVFGGKNCGYDWAIGGYIRLFNELLTSDKPLPIKLSGPCSTNYFNEYNRKIASTNANNEISPKVKFVVPYTLWNYIKNVKGSLDFIFKRAIDYIQQEDKLEDARKMIKSICYLTSKKIFNNANKNFALYISTIFNLSPEVIDAEIFSEIMSTFDKNKENGKFDWNNFLTMLSDCYWLLSHLRLKIVSSLFDLITKYPIESDLTRQSLIIFLASITSIDEFDHSLNDPILELVELLNPDPQLILCLLASYPNMLHNLSELPTKYEMKCNDRTINVFIRMFARTKCVKFTQYYLLSVLPSKDSVLLSTALLQMKIDNLETEYIIENCCRCCYIPEAWMNLLFLCTKKWHPLSDMDMNKLNSISLSNFDMNYAESFIKMLSLLVCSCFHMKELNFWVTFALILIEDFAKIVPTIPERIVKQQQFKYYILQLMTFGKKLHKTVLYPPVPQAQNAMNAMPFLEARGTHSNESCGEEYELNKVELTQKPDLIPNILKLVQSILPKEVSIRGNATYQLMNDYTVEAYDLYYANQILVAENWNDMIKKTIESFENVTFENEDKNEFFENNPLYRAVIRLLSAFVSNFESLQSIILNALSIFPNELYIDLRYQIIMSSLSLLLSSRSYKPSIVNIACDSALGGWISSNYVQVVSTLFSIFAHFKENPPPAFYSVIIFGFDVVDTSNLSEFMEVVTNNRKLLITPSIFSNIDIILAFLGKLLTIFGSLVNETFIVFMKHFSQIMNSSDSLIQYWGKNYPKIPFRNLLNPISNLAKGGIDSFLAWVNENADQFKNIEEILLDYLEKMHKTITSNRNKSISSVIETRVLNSEEFVNISHRAILNISHKYTFDHTIAAIVQMIFKKLFIFKNLHSIRERELYISSIYKLKFNNSTADYDEIKKETKRKSISLLSDPIYPTRRLEVSPLDYNLPKYPDGLVDDIMSTAEPKPIEYKETLGYPKCISDLFIYPYNKSKFLLAYSPHQIHLKFIQSMKITPQQNMNLLQILLNNGKQFNFIASCSILYGIDTINGTFFVCDDSFFFVEGLKLVSKNEADFEPPIDFNVQCFYSFLVLSGYFGKPLLYRGHLVIHLRSDEMIYISQHFWLHKPYSFSLNFLRGFNFVLNLNTKKDFRALGSIFKKAVSLNLDSAPPQSTVLSPINSVRLLSAQAKETANKWINGDISTYTYLCLLNRFGKRLTCDMTQYPVFPWILSDYTSDKIEDFTDSSFRDLSLPIGQINPERALHFDETYETSEHEYFYGSHYMHFGVVTYYLFRTDPYSYVSFIFHKGWDHPARMFIGVQIAWKASVDSSIDIKEIVPQFFSVPEIFENVSSYPLGTILNSDQRTDNVQLPNWASNPRDFTTKMLQFLEDIKVSSKINNWIDLIFGEKSRGQSAVTAKNVFPSYCYAKTPSHNFFDEVGIISGDDDDKEDDYIDEVLREANAIKIMNFGQCPHQLFTKIHPSIKYDDNQPNTVLTSSNWQILRADSFSMPPTMSFASPSSVFTLNSPYSMSAILPNGQFVVLKSNKIIVGRTTTTSNVYFDIEYDDPSNNSYTKPSISVSADGLYLCIARFEGILSLYRIYYNRGEVKSIRLVYTFETETGITTSAVSSEHFIIFAISGKSIHQYDIGLLKEIKDRIELPFVINNIQIDEIAALIYAFGDREIAICSISGEVLVTDKTGPFESLLPSDAQFYNFLADEVEESSNIQLSSNSSGAIRTSSNMNSSSSVSSGMNSGLSSSSLLNLSAKSSAIFRGSNNNVNFNLTSTNNLFASSSKNILSDNINFDVDEIVYSDTIERKITSVTLSKLPEHFKNRFFVIGFDDGSLDFWSVSFSETEKCKLIKLRSEKISLNSITTIAISTNAQRMIVGTNKCIRHLEAAPSSLPTLKKEQFAVICAYCKADIRKNSIICSKCGRFVCSKCCKKDSSTLKSYTCSSCLEKQCPDNENYGKDDDNI